MRQLQALEKEECTHSRRLYRSFYGCVYSSIVTVLHSISGALASGLLSVVVVIFSATETQTANLAATEIGASTTLIR